jgi:hypothetical protein
MLRHASLALVLSLACAGDPTDPSRLEDVPHEEVQASFSLALRASEMQQALPLRIPQAVAVDAPGQTLGLRARMLPIPARPGLVWLDLYIDNPGELGLRDVVVDLRSDAPLYELLRDPFNEQALAGPIEIGNIAAGGLGRVAVALPADRNAALTVAVRGTRTRRQSASSAPLAIARRSEELWVTVPDADRVVVIDTRTDRVLGEVEVPGAPASIALGPDERHVLVASRRHNQVVVIDRASRTIRQRLGESEGIGREPRHLVMAPDGRRVYVSAYVGDVVTALSRQGDDYRVEARLPVGRRPGGLSVTPDGRFLFVAHFLPRGTVPENEAWLSVLSTEPLAVDHEIPIEDLTGHRHSECRALLYPRAAFSDLMGESSATQLAGVFLDPAGGQGWTPGTRILGFPIYERGPGARDLPALVNSIPGEISSLFVFVTDTRQPQQSQMLPARAGVERPMPADYLRCAQVKTEFEFLHRTFLPGQEDAQVNRFPAFAAGVNGLSETGLSRFIGFSPGGRRAFILAYSSDELAVYDTATHHPLTQRHFQLSGANPTGMVSTTDGRKSYVSYANSLFVSVLDTSSYAEPAAQELAWVPYEYREVPGLPTAVSSALVRHVGDIADRPALREIGQIPLVADDPLPPLLRRGRILFSSSNPDKYPGLSSSRMGACATCHPDGGNDGSLWATMEGERRTMSLRGGIAGRGWLHASGTHRDAGEFVHTVVGERLGGHPGAADLHALAAYVAFAIERLQGPAVDAALAQRGQAVFERSCRGCHAGAAMSSGNPDPDSPWGGGASRGPILHDIGTATASAGVILRLVLVAAQLPDAIVALVDALHGDRALGPTDEVQRTFDFRPRPARARGAFKAPSLVNTWDNVLFFHDGRFTTLHQAVSYMNDSLGLDLSDGDLDAVVEYLKTL